MKSNNGQVNEKMLQLLMQVAISKSPVAVKDLSEQLSTPLSSLYRYVKMLKEWNLVEESPNGKCLIIGPAAMLFMHSYQRTPHDTQVLDTVLQRLQKQTREMAAYLVPVGYRALCVSKKESDQVIRCSFETGQSQPLLKGASSKVMLAYMPQERREKILRYFGKADEMEGWNQELEIIRQQGYAVSTSEIDPGVSGISAPVLKGTKLIGAVSVMAPAQRAEKNQKKIVLHVQQAARALPA